MTVGTLSASLLSPFHLNGAWYVIGAQETFAELMTKGTTSSLAWLEQRVKDRERERRGGRPSKTPIPG